MLCEIGTCILNVNIIASDTHNLYYCKETPEMPESFWFHILLLFVVLSLYFCIFLLLF